MTKRQPLNLIQKWQVSQYWVSQKQPLTRASYCVLMRLLDRQNPKTGLCDPSAIGLQEETGFSERSVRSSFKELEERGALKCYRVTRRSRNQFLIFSVAELQENRRLAGLKNQAVRKTNMNCIAAHPAVHCRSNLQPAAPETIKETIKKKESAENRDANISASPIAGKRLPSTQIGLGEFERRLVKVFEREGYGYKGLMMLPASDMELAYEEMSDGVLSFSDAVGCLLEQYRVFRASRE